MRSRRIDKLVFLLAAGAMSATIGCSSTGDHPPSDEESRAQTATVDEQPDEDDDGFDVARRLQIRDLPDVIPPSGPTPTTAALERRSEDQVRRVRADLRIVTRCEDAWCIDGVDSGETLMMRPEPSENELEVLAADKSWLERVVRVSWLDDEYVSLYVARSSFSGGAHANNILECRTYDRSTGQRLKLDEITDKDAASRLLDKANGLLEADRAIDELGFSLEAAGFEFDRSSFRLARTNATRGTRPEIILCARGPYPRESGTLLELRVDAVPASYLLE